LLLFFIENSKLAKKLFEIYEELKEEVVGLINTKYSKISEELSYNLDYERGKRHKFQYSMNLSIKKSYVQTSLKRAIEFVNKIELVVK